VFSRADNNHKYFVYQLDQGGFGKVYQARHKESGDILAVKSMRKDTTLQCDARSPTQRVSVA
jgi:hypothetical protein